MICKAPRACPLCDGSALLATEHGRELELSVLDDVAAHDLERGVAVLVEAPSAEHAVGLLRLGDCLNHRCAVLLSGAAQRIDGHAGCDVTVGRISFRLRLEALAIALHELRALA